MAREVSINPTKDTNITVVREEEEEKERSSRVREGGREGCRIFRAAAGQETRRSGGSRSKGGGSTLRWPLVVVGI